MGKSRFLVHGHQEKTDGYQLIDSDVFLNNGVAENIEISYSTHQLTPGQKHVVGREVLITNY